MNTPRGYHRVSIVFHPASGHGRGLSRARALHATLQDAERNPQLVDTSQVPRSELPSRLRGSDAVVIVGGDGLVHSCLPALIDLGIPMGILPAGSGNDAWRMGRASSVRSTREAILGFLAGHGRIRTSDVLEVSFANEPQRTRFVLGAVSCGFEAQVNEAANALPRWLGATRYGLALLLCLPRIKPRQLSISADGFSFHGGVYLASLANIRTLGGGIGLFPAARDDDGRMDAMIVTAAPLYRVLPRIVQILTGREHRYRRAGVFSAARVEFAGTSYGDGEQLGTGDFRVTVRPGCLSLMDVSAGIR